METIETSSNTVEKIQTAEIVGDSAVRKEKVISTRQVDGKELTLSKVNKVVWLIVNLIGIVILLRFVFLLLGANIYGFSKFIVDVSNPFVRMFQGIFPASRVEGAYFDTAALLAIGMWYLLGFIITTILNIFSNRPQE